MKKKLLSIVLALAMSSSMLPLSAMAASTDGALSDEGLTRLLTEESAAIDSRIEGQIQSELAYLTEVGLLSSAVGSLSAIAIDDTAAPYAGAYATITYTLDFGGAEEDIVFRALSDTYQSFSAYDRTKGIADTVSFTAQDRVFLDGEEVLRTETAAPQSVAAPDSTRASDRFYQVQCPYGTASDYSNYPTTTVTNDIALKKALRDITFSAAFTIVGSLLGVGLVTAIFTQSLFILLQDSAPTSQGLSSRDAKYWHKSCGAASGGHISAYGAYVTKHVFTWYPKTYLQGTGRNTVEYEIHRIY